MAGQILLAGRREFLFRPIGIMVEAEVDVMGEHRRGFLGGSVPSGFSFEGSAIIAPTRIRARGGLSDLRDAWISLGAGLHFIGCFLKNSQIRSLAEMFLVDLPMNSTGGCWPGHVCPPPSMMNSTTSAPSLPGP